MPDSYRLVSTAIIGAEGITKARHAMLRKEQVPSRRGCCHEKSAYTMRTSLPYSLMHSHSHTHTHTYTPTHKRTHARTHMHKRTRAHMHIEDSHTVQCIPLSLTEHATATSCITTKLHTPIAMQAVYSVLATLAYFQVIQRNADAHLSSNEAYGR